jgi:hypothetical protein
MIRSRPRDPLDPGTTWASGVLPLLCGLLLAGLLGLVLAGLLQAAVAHDRAGHDRTPSDAVQLGPFRWEPELVV